jgi:hypothetical protein
VSDPPRDRVVLSRTSYGRDTLAPLPSPFTRQAAHARASSAMTAAAAEAAPNAPRRKRTSVLVALSAACVALLAYALAPALRAAPDVALPRPTAEGQCSCNVRLRHLLCATARTLTAALASQRRRQGLHRRRRLCPTCASRRAVRLPGASHAVPRLLPQGLQELTGTVEDCCCDFETVDRLNEVRRRARGGWREPRDAAARRFREPHARHAHRRCCTRSCRS